MGHAIARGSSLERSCVNTLNNDSAYNGLRTTCKREALPHLRGAFPYVTVPKCSPKRSINVCENVHLRSKSITPH